LTHALGRVISNAPRKRDGENDQQEEKEQVEPHIGAKRIERIGTEHHRDQKAQCHIDADDAEAVDDGIADALSPWSCFAW
jgi:hypothetical protein